MTVLTRALVPSDLPRVLELNNAAVPAVNALAPELLAELVEESLGAIAVVASADPERVLGFSLVFGPGARYESENYRWFAERSEEFLYVDRIVIGEGNRGLGLGPEIYRRIFETARESGLGVVNCEVNVVPPNPGSLAFHARLGFARLGINATKGGEAAVAMLAAPAETSATRPSTPDAPLGASGLSAPEVLGRAEAAAAILLGRALSLAPTPERLAEPSALPGWDRATLLAHLSTLARALTAQLALARRGETGPVYPGGPEGRAEGIRLAAERSPAAILEEFADALAALSAAWPRERSAWEAPVSYRSGTVADLALLWWREAAIHLLDLNLGDTAEGWSPALCAHLEEFLGERLPAHERVALEPSDLSAGDPPLAAGITAGGADALGRLRVRGPRAQIAAWLAGRVPAETVTADIGGEPAPLPALGPWPTRP